MEMNDESGKAENFMKDLGKKIDRFVVELKDFSSKAEVEFKSKYDELKTAAEKLKAEGENKERWKEVEQSLKKASSALENAFKAAFKKKDEDKPS